MNWIYKLIKPVDPKEAGDYLVRCDCGRMMWLRAPDKIRRHHAGHKIKVMEHGSFMDFFRLKLGFINRRTIGEYLKDKMEGRAE